MIESSIAYASVTPQLKILQSIFCFFLMTRLKKKILLMLKKYILFEHKLWIKNYHNKNLYLKANAITMCMNVTIRCWVFHPIALPSISGNFQHYIKWAFKTTFWFFGHQCFKLQNCQFRHHPFDICPSAKYNIKQLTLRYITLSDPRSPKTENLDFLLDTLY